MKLFFHLLQFYTFIKQATSRIKSDKYDFYFSENATENGSLIINNLVTTKNGKLFILEPRIKNKNRLLQEEKTKVMNQVLTNVEKSVNVVGGEDVTKEKYLGNYQFMCGALQARIDDGEHIRLSHACGCTLLAPNVALTAAHCKDYIDYVQIGNLNLSYEENKRMGLDVEFHKVVTKRTHPLWDPNTFSYDIMLLKLDGEVLVDHKKFVKLQMTALPRNETDVFTIAGWGVTKYGDNSVSNILKEVQVRYHPRDKCTKMFGDLFTSSMFCAYADKKDACQGDSGGPILHYKQGKNGEDGEFIQEGIISWGIECGGIYPGVFSKLSGDTSIRQFIHHWICSEKRGYSPSICINGVFPNFV